TFATQSLLGAALVGQQKEADAEPLLAQGYAGMKKHQAKIPKDHTHYLTEALERLVRLYDARRNQAEADRVRKEREAAKTEPRDRGRGSAASPAADRGLVSPSHAWHCAPPARATVDTQDRVAPCPGGRESCPSPAPRPRL